MEGGSLAAGAGSGGGLDSVAEGDVAADVGLSSEAAGVGAGVALSSFVAWGFAFFFFGAWPRFAACFAGFAGFAGACFTARLGAAGFACCCGIVGFSEKVLTF